MTETIYTDEMIEACEDVLRAYLERVGVLTARSDVRRIVLWSISGIPWHRGGDAWERGAFDVVIATARALGWPRKP